MTGSPDRFAARVASAARVAALWADEVDRDGRFPAEAIAELAGSGLLAASIPVAAGGEGASLVELSVIATALGAACSSTGLIFAMHTGQVLCLVRHNTDQSPAIAAVLASVVDDGVLIASATTEIGIGGDSRTSGCAVSRSGTDLVIEKTTPVISYGLHAGAVLVTARRDADSAPSDQVVVVVPADRIELEPLGDWNTLGFRGTSSPGFRLRAQLPEGHLLGAPFADVSAQTMLPVSHVLWASVWLGIASAATGTARRTVQKAARKTPGSVPAGATRLAELLIELQVFSDTVSASAARYDAHRDDAEALTSISSLIAMNGLKITASERVVQIVGAALLIVGIAGYRLDTEVSLGRVLRDAHGAALMVNNDRILGNSAALSLLARSPR